MRQAAESAITSKTITAPTAGWNTRDALAAMNVKYAVVMENFYPTSATVNLRPGRVSWATGLAGSVKTLIPFLPGTNNRLYAVTENGFYDVTFAGVVGGAVTACTNARWEYRNFRNSAGPWLVAVNGIDNLKLYNGVTWQAINAASTPAITGIATSSLTNVHLFKHRLWFTQVNSLSAWYLPLDAIAGALTEFPMGPIFGRGGYIVAQESWTVDGGSGSDNNLVTVTSEGEMSVYQGTDPASASTFALIGVYNVGKPLGKRCLIKYGGDLLYLSLNGIFPLSKLLLSATLDRSISLNNTIDEAFKDSSSLYSANFGWQHILHPTQNALIVNVPFNEGGTTYQFVMNDITKAWCKFTNWNMDCMAEFQGQIYSAQGTSVTQLWQGTSDLGQSVMGKCQQAYFSLGRAGKINLTRPNVSVLGNVTLQTAIDTDFSLFSGIVEDSYISIVSSTTYWDSGIWDSSTWSGGVTPIANNWISNTNNPGIFHSFRLQCTSSVATLNWTSTDFGIVTTGIL